MRVVHTDTAGTRNGADVQMHRIERDAIRNRESNIEEREGLGDRTRRRRKRNDGGGRREDTTEEEEAQG